MVRKRGNKSTKSGHTKKPKALNRKDSSVQKWNTRDDIPMDEEDQFHHSRDKILLGNDDDVDGVDEEDVFALEGISEDEDDEDEDEDVDMDALPPSKTKAVNKKSRGKGKVVDSDESDESSEEEEGWGQSRAAYYSSNAAQLESDDDEGNELEEQEAKRLQAKIRQTMTDDDFGFNDPIDLTSTADDDVFGFAAPAVQQLPSDDAALIRHFEKTDPESLALARDFTDTANTLLKTQKHIEAAEADNPDGVKLGMLHLYYQTLLTYTSTLAFYIHLRSTSKHAQHPELLRTHPIMSRLLTLKQSIITMEDLDFGISDSDREFDEDDDDLEGFSDLDMDMEPEVDLMKDAEELWAQGRKKPLLEDDELDDLLSDAEAEVPMPKIRIKPLQAPPISFSERPKKKRKTNDASKGGVVFDLVEPEFTTTAQSSFLSKVDASTADGFGEATELQYADAEDKKARKKTLRFHTSRIESASARRKGARNEAAGGDDDIPYRERKKAKDIRLEEEAKKRLAKQGGEDLNDVEPTAGAMDVDRDKGVEVEDAEGYYDLVKRQKQEKKAKKQAEHEERTARVDYVDTESSGPRALTRAILKNKGLTPHRPKTVRNPRVKKRIKFDQAKKKISSQKAVYKGGDGGKYEGEKSGISKVVKSIRLG